MALKIVQIDPAGAGERWVDFDEQISFKLASLGDDKYRISLERARRLIAREDAKQELSSVSVTAADRNEQDIQCDLVGRYIIKDWRGPIEDAQGNPIEYSPQAASDLLRCNAGVLVWVIQQAAQIAADYAMEVQETVGKPSPASSGSRNGKARAKSKG